MTPVLALFAPALLAPVPAQQQPPPNAPEFGGSSPIGLVVILLLFIAMFFLIRSMNTHLRKVPSTFDKPDEAKNADPAADEVHGTDSGPDGEARDGQG